MAQHSFQIDLASLGLQIGQHALRVAVSDGTHQTDLAPIVFEQTAVGPAPAPGYPMLESAQKIRVYDTAGEIGNTQVYPFPTEFMVSTSEDYPTVTTGQNFAFLLTWGNVFKRLSAGTYRPGSSELAYAALFIDGLRVDTNLDNGAMPTDLPALLNTQDRCLLPIPSINSAGDHTLQIVLTFNRFENGGWVPITVKYTETIHVVDGGAGTSYASALPLALGTWDTQSVPRGQKLFYKFTVAGITGHTDKYFRFRVKAEVDDCPLALHRLDSSLLQNTTGQGNPISTGVYLAGMSFLSDGDYYLVVAPKNRAFGAEGTADMPVTIRASVVTGPTGMDSADGVPLVGVVPTWGTPTGGPTPIAGFLPIDYAPQGLPAPAYSISTEADWVAAGFSTVPKWEVVVDGEVVMTSLNKVIIKAPLELRGLADGPHRYFVRATDINGVTVTSGSMFFSTFLSYGTPSNPELLGISVFQNWLRGFGTPVFIGREGDVLAKRITVENGKTLEISVSNIRPDDDISLVFKDAYGATILAPLPLYKWVPPGSSTETVTFAIPTGTSGAITVECHINALHSQTPWHTYLPTGSCQIAGKLT